MQRLGRKHGLTDDSTLLWQARDHHHERLTLPSCFFYTGASWCLLSSSSSSASSQEWFKLFSGKCSLGEDCQRLGKIVLMRLDGNGTAVASPASDSPLWRVGPLQSQSRDRSPISLPLVRTNERDREEARRREESRRREEESEREQGRKREGKLYIRDVRSQSIPPGIPITSPLFPSPNFTVGYALTSKKIKSFMQPKLEVYARSKGISLVAIDRSKPLTEQGPFDVLLHKFTGTEWSRLLEDYKAKYPEVIVLDPPEAIQQLRNRQSMLQDVAQLNLCHFGGHVGVPKQLVVTENAACIPAQVAAAGLRLPLVAKPLVADGSDKSHAMSLAYDTNCLRELDPPLVLQEFVNHGGVLFKVYIVGDFVRVVRRYSLPDLQEGESTVSNGIMPFPRVSCAAATISDLDPKAAELPPRELLDCLSKELRHRLGLHLFNLDIIREGGVGNNYYVIDINYFPGYGKMPDYEMVFTDFLLTLSTTKNEKAAIKSLEHNVLSSANTENTARKEEPGLPIDKINVNITTKEELVTLSSKDETTAATCEEIPCEDT